MKSTGIVRKVDDLGRICLPMELRKQFNLKARKTFADTGSSVAFSKDGDLIILEASKEGRQIDPLGRVVIPSEVRRTLGIEEKNPLEIYVEGKQIILKKYEPGCIFCGDARDVVNYKGKNVCKACVKELRND